MPNPTEPGARPGYNHHFETVEISSQERAIGTATNKLFLGKLKRELPWFYKDGKIHIYKPYLEQTELEYTPGMRRNPDIRARLLLTDGLEKETISDPLADVFADVKMVEDKLAFFMRAAKNMFWKNRGLARSYGQWDVEEGQHGDGFGLILQMTQRLPDKKAESGTREARTNHKTEEELTKEFYDNLTKTWEPPFPTERQMVTYAAIQEKMTNRNYLALHDSALREDAPITAELLNIIAHDEAYHGGGYMAFLRIYAEYDLEGTIDDTYYVASNFEMPVQKLLRDPQKSLRNLVKVGAFDRDRVAYDTMLPVLRGLGFFPEHLARQAAANYVKRGELDPEKAQFSRFDKAGEARTRLILPR